MTQAVRRVAALAVATLSFLVVAQALACESNFPGARRAESSRYVVAYRMKPVKPAVSAQFSINLTEAQIADLVAFLESLTERKPLARRPLTSGTTCR